MIAAIRTTVADLRHAHCAADNHAEALRQNVAWDEVPAAEVRALDIEEAYIAFHETIDIDALSARAEAAKHALCDGRTLGPLIFRDDAHTSIAAIARIRAIRGGGITDGAVSDELSRRERNTGVPISRAQAARHVHVRLMRHALLSLSYAEDAAKQLGDHTASFAGLS